MALLDSPKEDLKLAKTKLQTLGVSILKGSSSQPVQKLVLPEKAGGQGHGGQGLSAAEQRPVVGGDV